MRSVKLFVVVVLFVERRGRGRRLRAPLLPILVFGFIVVVVILFVIVVVVVVSLVIVVVVVMVIVVIPFPDRHRSFVCFAFLRGGGGILSSGLGPWAYSSVSKAPLPPPVLTRP